MYESTGYLYDDFSSSHDCDLVVNYAREIGAVVLEVPRTRKVFVTADGHLQVRCVDPSSSSRARRGGADLVHPAQRVHQEADGSSAAGGGGVSCGDRRCARMSGRVRRRWSRAAPTRARGCRTGDRCDVDRIERHSLLPQVAVYMARKPHTVACTLRNALLRLCAAAVPVLESLSWPGPSETQLDKTSGERGRGAATPALARRCCPGARAPRTGHHAALPRPVSSSGEPRRHPSLPPSRSLRPLDPAALQHRADRREWAGRGQDAAQGRQRARGACGGGQHAGRVGGRLDCGSGRVERVDTSSSWPIP